MQAKSGLLVSYIFLILTPPSYLSLFPEMSRPKAFLKQNNKKKTKEKVIASSFSLWDDADHDVAARNGR